MDNFEFMQRHSEEILALESSSVTSGLKFVGGSITSAAKSLFQKLKMLFRRKSAQDIKEAQELFGFSKKGKDTSKPNPDDVVTYITHNYDKLHAIYDNMPSQYLIDDGNEVQSLALQLFQMMKQNILWENNVCLMVHKYGSKNTGKDGIVVSIASRFDDPANNLMARGFGVLRTTPHSLEEAIKLRETQDVTIDADMYFYKIWDCDKGSYFDKPEEFHMANANLTLKKYS